VANVAERSDAREAREAILKRLYATRAKALIEPSREGYENAHDPG
jgi:hypothetical protein